MLAQKAAQVQAALSGARPNYVLPTKQCRTKKLAAARLNRGMADILATSSAALVIATPAWAQDVVLSSGPQMPESFTKAPDAFDQAVDSAVRAAKLTSEVLKGAYNTAEDGYEVLQKGYSAAAPYVTSAVDAASPVVLEAFKFTSNAAAPTLKALLPQVKEAEQALSSAIPSGLVETTTSVTKVTSEALTAAAPFINKFVQFVTTTDALTLGEYALGLVAFTYVAPGLLGVVFNSFRGYSDDLASAAALSMLVNEGNSLLVDIRSTREKEGSGIPDLPSSASGKVIEVEYAVTEDKRLRGQLRDVSSIEAQITALQIASLKRVSQGTRIIILDKNSSAARVVAKELARKGYGKVYVIEGGFDGRNGWVQSKLQIKPTASVISSGSLRNIIGTQKSVNSKALMAPRA